MLAEVAGCTDEKDVLEVLCHNANLRCVVFYRSVDEVEILGSTAFF